MHCANLIMAYQNFALSQAHSDAMQNRITDSDLTFGLVIPSQVIRKNNNNLWTLLFPSSPIQYASFQLRRCQVPNGWVVGSLKGKWFTEQRSNLILRLFYSDCVLFMHGNGKNEFDRNWWHSGRRALRFGKFVQPLQTGRMTSISRPIAKKHTNTQITFHHRTDKNHFRICLETSWHTIAHTLTKTQLPVFGYRDFDTFGCVGNVSTFITAEDRDTGNLIWPKRKADFFFSFTWLIYANPNIFIIYVCARVRRLQSRVQRVFIFRALL